MNQLDFSYSDERFADIQLLRYRLNGFEKLSKNQKLLVYYLSEAALCGRDITTDQNCKYNLRIRKLLGFPTGFIIIMDVRSSQLISLKIFSCLRLTKYQSLNFLC